MNAPLFQTDIEQRRRMLGISLEELAARSGVSRATVIRILKDYRSGTFDSVEKISQVLGLSVVPTPIADTEKMRNEQARNKAERIVAMLQGSMGLEAQAVGGDDLEELIERTATELLQSNRRLWAG